ncbi:hypothetical protein EW145_g930 [Phellinidium pouzarii]|uniref:Aminotransferase class V domain-containing protein n=1 Tax=Phellinidium pouzarii TaxID=167371 RepID=A0A4S4LGG1_9AGAM|nr:hypothetical protein EW145_g930 [Phellinidium pouzarii]
MSQVTKSEEPPAFGHPMLQQFLFEPTYINLNNGSYGSLPLPVLEACERLSREIEANPDRYMRSTYLSPLKTVRARVAKLVNAEIDECVIVPNATHGVNTVLRNFDWNQGDVIVKSKYISDSPPHPQQNDLTMNFPTTASDILERFRAHLKGTPRQHGCKIVAVIDSIVSVPGALLPWKEMVEICKDEGVLSVIDAAHSIGQETHIDLKKADPDFWISNCHKWLYAKRGCAVLYVPKRNQHLIKTTLPTSAFYVSPVDPPGGPEAPNFVVQFQWTGTRDLVPYLSVIKALDFREWLGGEEKINEYCHNLALTGGKRLAEILGTSVIDENGEFTANMVNVEVPLAVNGSIETNLRLRESLSNDWNISAQTYYHNGRWWVRCSAQIYNEPPQLSSLELRTGLRRDGSAVDLRPVLKATRLHASRMAPRTVARAAASSSSTPALARGTSAIAQPASTTSPQLRELRRQWKWAAFSQFFYTFAPLVALEDVVLVDIEEDLINSTMVVLPRLMQRLLMTLSQDRKITVENWQTALRRQYLRRDPDDNPIGIEPVAPRNSRATTIESDLKVDQREDDEEDTSEHAEDERKDATIMETSAETDDGLGSEQGECEYNPAGKTERKSERSGNVNSPQPDTKSEGDEDEVPSVKDWANLAMLEKLDSIHTVVEWHFQTPLRLRSVMHSDDENASWRIEPIGYDAKRNAYWLIGSDRLWIQRTPPKPPKKNTKRKATSEFSNQKSKVSRIVWSESKAASSCNNSPLVQGSVKRQSESRGRSSIRGRPKRTRGSVRPNDFEDALASTPGGSGRARAAKTRANVKLDLQAKQLAAAKAEMQSLNRRARSSPSKQGVLGTRASRRLRGNDDDDEWQQIPPEWLVANESLEAKTNGISGRTNANGNWTPRKCRQSPHSNAPAARDSIDKTWLESGDESDLTELSDSETSCRKADEATAEVLEEQDTAVEEFQDSSKDDKPAELWPPSDFVEWETICVSLQEWETIAQQFEKATHYLEKALNKLLTQEIVPFVIESLREVESNRAKEEALMNRKRSSRIAVKETEKEIARLAAAKQMEEAEKMARMRRLEARTRKEEEERLKREQGREQRRKEREERELLRRQRIEQTSAKTEVDASTDDLSTAPTGPDNIPMESIKVSKFSRRNSPRGHSEQKASGDDWELDCEVCGAKGINKDEGLPLMSCGNCNKWQHIACHDSLDKHAGRTLRDWNVVEFTCRHCLTHSDNLNSWYQPSRLHPEDSGRESNASLRHDHQDDRPGQVRMTSTDHRQPTNGRNSHLPYSDINYTQTPNMPPGRQSIDVTASVSEKKPSQSLASVTFAHYQPLQHGFSPHPTGLRHQQQLQPHLVAHSPHPAFSEQEMATTWNEQARGNAYHPQLNGSSAPQAQYTERSIEIPHGVSSSHAQQSYPMISSGLPHDHSMPIQYAHAYSNQQQQPTYGNESFYHPQV